MALLLRKGFKEEDFAFLHPGGRLGKRFLRVVDLAHSGNDLPVVERNTEMHDVIYEMSKKGFGVTAVVEGDRKLAGIITDGDLRRLLQKDENILRKSAGESMKPNPLTIDGNELASAALEMMEQRKVTSLFIVDDAHRVTGIIHLHDLWGLELF